MPRFRRLAAFVIVLVLASSLAVAAPRPTADGWQGEKAAAIAPVETLLPRLWGWLTRSWTKAGCIIDPSGACQESGTTAETPEAGCVIDPNSSQCAGGR